MTSPQSSWVRLGTQVFLRIFILVFSVCGFFAILFGRSGWILGLALTVFLGLVLSAFSERLLIRWFRARPADQAIPGSERTFERTYQRIRSQDGKQRFSGRTPRFYWVSDPYPELFVARAVGRSGAVFLHEGLIRFLGEGELRLVLEQALRVQRRLAWTGITWLALIAMSWIAMIPKSIAPLLLSAFTSSNSSRSQTLASVSLPKFLWGWICLSMAHPFEHLAREWVIRLERETWPEMTAQSELQAVRAEIRGFLGQMRVGSASSSQLRRRAGLSALYFVDPELQ